MVAAGRMKTMIWKGNWRRRGLISSATATDQRQGVCPAAGPCHRSRAALLRLLRLVPLHKSVLNLGRCLLRTELPADHARADSPQLVFEVGFPSGPDLVRIADGGLACAPPVQERLSQRILQRDFLVREAEEPRQGVAVQAGKL